MSRDVASQAGPPARAGRGRIVRMALGAAPALALALALAACATPAFVSPVEVTRFVGSAPQVLGQGTISVAAEPGSLASAHELAPYRDGIAVELARLGYRVVPQGGEQVAQVSLERDVIGARERRPVSVGGGASVGSYGSGVGLGIGLDLSGRPADRIETRLALAIRARAGGANLWEGRAAMVASANSDFAAPEAAAQRLASALLRDFPGRSGETVTVE